MNWICLLFLFFGQNLWANIYVRLPELDPAQFKEIVHDKQGQMLSSWLAAKDFSQTRTESLLNLGEKFLRAEINLSQFLAAANKLTDDEIPNPEWRQALIDILLKKNEGAQKELPEVWGHICYFYHLDEAIQERWPQFYQRCNPGKISLTKPEFLKNDLVYVDGVEWKDKINFFPRKSSGAWAIQIRIYSDAEAPQQLKTNDLHLPSLSRTSLAHGHCGQFQFSKEVLSKYELPLLQIFVILNPTCIEPVLTPPSLQAPSIWRKDNKWLWLAGLIVSGFIIHELKDKEIIFESP